MSAGYLNYVSDEGIAWVAGQHLCPNLLHALLPALVNDTAPNPANLILLAPDQRNISDLSSHDFMVHSAKHVEMYPNLEYIEFLEYMLRIPPENILWSKPKQPNTPVDMLWYHHKFLSDLPLTKSHQFKRYLLRLEQFLRAISKENLFEPRLGGRHAGYFIPLGDKLTWGKYHTKWHVPSPQNQSILQRLLSTRKK